MKQPFRVAPALPVVFVLQFFLASSLAIAAAPGSAGAGKRAFGESTPVGNGMAWAWVEYGAKKAPVAIGLTFTETALSGLPATMHPTEEETYEYHLPLPAKSPVRPYTHLVLNWNPHGHMPAGIYDVPHFDFHFYIISEAKRMKIKCKDADMPKCMKKPRAEFVPADYILPPGTNVPEMGVHWIDQTGPEFNKQPFTRTFIYGSYDGHVAFLEPMVALSYLETKPDVTGTIKVPAKYQAHGYYPTTYAVKYDPVRKEYSVSLEGLVRK